MTNDHVSATRRTKKERGQQEERVNNVAGRSLKQELRICFCNEINHLNGMQPALIDEGEQCGYLEETLH